MFPVAFVILLNCRNNLFTFVPVKFCVQFSFCFFDFLIYFTDSLLTETLPDHITCDVSARKNDWRFLCQFQEMLHRGYHLKVPHKLIAHVELFYHDDILTKMFYVIRILLTCHLTCLALKLFFFTSKLVGWYLYHVS